MITAAIGGLMAYVGDQLRGNVHASEDQVKFGSNADQRLIQRYT